LFAERAVTIGEKQFNWIHVQGTNYSGSTGNR
jgi:hypothetical protein